MKHETKSEILRTASRLFGEHGYNNVSMRNIADACNISVGNLTYYFSRKEDLISAAVVEQHADYKRPPACSTLPELDRYFLSILHHQQKKDYYFRHYAQLAERYPEVYSIQVEILGHMHDALFESILGCASGGHFAPEEWPGQYQYVTKALMSVAVYGIPQPEQPAKEERLPIRRRTLWAILYPYLSDAGKQIFKESIFGEWSRNENSMRE